MVNEQLIQYVIKELQAGFRSEDIINKLSLRGWNNADINTAMQIGLSSIQQSIPAQNPQVIQQNNNSQIQYDSVAGQKKTHKKLLFFMAIIIGFIIVAGAGAYYYFNSPKYIFAKMINNTISLKSFEYTGTIESKIRFSQPSMPLGLPSVPPTNSSEKKNANFNIQFNGKSNTQDINNPKSMFNFNIATDIIENKSETFGLEFRFIDKVNYLKPTGLPKTKHYDLTFLNNKWVKIDTEEISSRLPTPTEPPKQVQQASGLTKQQLEQIAKLVEKTKIIKSINEYDQEIIYNQQTRHFGIELDKKELITFMIESSKILSQNSKTGQKTITEQEKQKMLEGIDKVDIPELHFWIGIKDNNLYKFSITFVINESQESFAAGTFSGTVLFNNHNKEVVIEVPADTMTFQEAFMELFKGLPYNSGTIPDPDNPYTLPY